ncbi:MAG TPA: 2-oxoacid:acceptor oxidoreductase subunit alpha [Gemmatimonadota bacterium]|nr:2-oxoacid:acceptor oxidoreductase subunit alpha [Gemmatimonadota bacterium]
MISAADRVNDFALKIGTVNGTGSASANGLLMQAIFRMGVPVTGKNVFPSNIQGLPTWYEIRVNKDGYTARTPQFDLIVAMNPSTYERDITEVRSGGWLLYDSSWPLDAPLLRDDVTFLGVPLGSLCVEAFQGDRERVLMKNITYVGALAAFLDIDMDMVQGMLEEKFSRKKALLESNHTAIHLGYDYVRENFDAPLPIRLERMDGTRGHILIDGNTAAALGCLYAGATVGAWYPITPATSLMDAFTMFCERFRVDPETGKKRFCIVQAEDELAAAGVVVGAGWAGARAFSPTAGPGISLMSEFIGLAYYAEIPIVLFDIQRTGPSTGMPTRTQQGDLLQVAYASHGDTKHIALFPANPEECFAMAVQAFDLAERFQTPVFVVSDLDIGMNDWMCPTLQWDDGYRPDRGKVLSAEELEHIGVFHRYLDGDVDGQGKPDGIASRTLPGVHPKGAYVARGSGHTKYGTYTEDSAEYVEVMERLTLKLASAAKAVPEPEIRAAGGKGGNGAAGGRPAHGAGPIGIVTIGGCRAAVLEAVERLAEEGIVLDYLRVRGFPFDDSVREFLDSHDLSFVVEQNRDGQLRSLLLLETGVAPERLASVRYYGGLPLSTHHVIEGVTGRLEARAGVGAPVPTYPA